MIERELYLNQIKPYMNKHIIKVLTGIRRSGKSTILKQIANQLKNDGVSDENIILINLELEKYLDIRNWKQLSSLINSMLNNKGKNKNNNNNRKYLFLDEVQKVEGWEKLVNAYFAEDKFDIYVTGSNAKLLSGELATYLSGRYIEIKIYPFSFREFLKYNKKHKINKKTSDFFKDYINYGAMPSTLKYKNHRKIPVLRDIYNTIILKDIVSRYEIKDIDLLTRILLFLMGNIGQLFSANSIVKYLKKDNVKISTKTIYNYLTYLEDVSFINKVKREDLVGKKLLNFIEKFYLVDLGFRQMIYGNNEKDIGQSLENIVYNELLRQGYDITIGKFKDKEVDFVCKKHNKKIYIQVAYILAEESTIKREFDPLMKINDNYPKYVLSMDEFDRSKEGIKHINIIDFLTGDALL